MVVCGGLCSMYKLLPGFVFQSWLNSNGCYASFLHIRCYSACTFKSHTVRRENECSTKDSDDNCSQAVHQAHSDSCYNHAVQVTIAFLNPVIVFRTFGVIFPSLLDRLQTAMSPVSSIITLHQRMGAIRQCTTNVYFHIPL